MQNILDISNKRIRTIAILAGIAAALTLALNATVASAATKYTNYDAGRGSCLLRDMGSLGSGGNSTISTPAGVAETSDWGYWVISKRWTIVVDAVTGRRITERYEGAQWLAPYGWNSLPVRTVDIPSRSTTDYGLVKVQLLTAYYNPTTNELLEVDTGTASSYWVYKNGAFGVYRLNQPAISC
jgi:hypothetical protein